MTIPHWDFQVGWRSTINDSEFRGPVGELPRARRSRSVAPGYACGRWNANAHTHGHTLLFYRYRLLLAILSTVVFVLALVIGLAIAVIGFQLWKATKGLAPPPDNPTQFAPLRLGSGLSKKKKKKKKICFWRQGDPKLSKQRRTSDFAFFFFFLNCLM